jgi:glyoxylase-like metal-dependent hydrolase (beta-lactamase superfamily II)
MLQIKTFTFNFFGENTYIAFDETKEAVIIDCGAMSKTEEAAVNSFIKDNSLTLKHLLTTHYHFDHVAGNGFIFEKYNLRPSMHQGEWTEKTPGINQQAARFGIPAIFKDIEPGHFINEGDEIKFGNTTFKTLLLPGHSPASLCFHSAKDGIALTGDTIFQGSIGRTDLWGGDHDTLINAIKKEILTLTDKTILYPGHGPSTTVGFERKNNPFLTKQANKTI